MKRAGLIFVLSLACLVYGCSGSSKTLEGVGGVPQMGDDQPISLSGQGSETDTTRSASINGCGSGQGGHGGHGGHGGPGGGSQNDCFRPEGSLGSLNLYSGRDSVQLGTVSLSIDERQNLIVRSQLGDSTAEFSSLRLFIGRSAPRTSKSGSENNGWQRQMRNDYGWGPFAHDAWNLRDGEDVFRIPLRSIDADCGSCDSGAATYFFAVHAEGRTRGRHGGGGNWKSWEAYAWTPQGRVIFPGQDWKSYDRSALSFPACDDGSGGDPGGGGGGVNQAPLADLRADRSSGTKPLAVNFDASSSSDPDGSIVDYEWDFDGDGAFNEAGAESAARGDSTPATYTYTAVGSYDAAVRVTDNAGAQARASLLIRVVIGAPTAQLSANPASGEKPLVVSFDASASFDSDGTLVNFEWDFDGNGLFGEAGAETSAAGDSTPAPYTYSSTGSFNAAVRVTDDDSAIAIASQSIVVGNGSPLVSLTANPASGNKPLSVTYDASGSSDPGGSIVNFEWDFDGNGVFGEAGAEASAAGDSTPAPQTYSSVASFNAAVRVTDDDGAQATALQAISVTNAPPLASLSSDVSSGPKPLSVNLDASASSDPGGTIVAYMWDFDADGIFGEPGAELDAAGQTNPAPLTYSSTGTYNPTVRVTDDDGAQSFASVAITVTNTPPTASLSGDPLFGDAPLTVSFDGSASSDPGGSVVDYEWDFDGNGIYNEPGFEAGAQGSALASADYTVIGNYTATLRVTDDDGATATASLSLTAGGWGTPVTLDSTGLTGYYSALANVGGNPAIAYWDNTNDDLRFVRALDAAGSAWGAPVTVDAPGSVGEYCCLALVNGNPAISYYDTGNGDLLYVRATNSTGSAWGARQILDSAGNTGQYTSLLQLAAGPAISYFDVTGGNLRYIAALDSDGSAWAAPQTLDSTGTTGQYTSLALVAGNPAISYYDASQTNLRYIRASDPGGSVWGGPLTLDSAGNTGLYTSLEVINGSPAIAFQHGGNADLKYVRALDATGGAWGSPLVLDSAGNTGQYASLATIGGRPAIACYDASNHDLRYLRALDSSGAAWPAAFTLDSAGFTGAYSNLAPVNGTAAISYQDVSNNDLRYIRYLP